MALREDIQKQGEFLFRWRSYLPLLALPIFFAALGYPEYIGRSLDDSGRQLWAITCIFISFCGLGIRCMVSGFVPRGTSGRNTKTQVADTLNTSGMYSITRNPLYLGNFIIVLGIFLFVGVWWFIVVGVIGFMFYYERIIFTEEEYLRKKFNETFLKWAEKTPMFLPRLENWQRPALSFSGKTMLRREYSTFFAIIASFTFLDILMGIFREGKVSLKTGWIIFFLSGLAIYLFLMMLKKKTKKLDVRGR